MFSSYRRRFLGQAAAATVACSTDFAFGRALFAQAPAASAGQEARVFLDTRRTVSPIDRNLFGSFLEHLGRAMNMYVRSVGMLVAFLTLLAVAVRAAGALSGERDKQTFDGILTTPLDAAACTMFSWWRMTSVIGPSLVTNTSVSTPSSAPRSAAGSS